MKNFTKLFTIFMLLCANTLLAQYSNATLNGPWFLHTVPIYPHDDSLNYLVFDGSGNIIDGNMFGSVGGNYSVTSGGAISGTLIIVRSSIDSFPLAAQLISQNVATMGNSLLSRVTNAGALTDTLVGILSTTICGQKNVTIVLNSQGQVISAIGLTAPVSGRVYADSGVFIGHLKTGHTDYWNEFSIWGYYANDSLNGGVGLDAPRTSPCRNGIASLIRKGTVTSAEELSPTAPTPTAFALSQNYPNPFNPTTTISFTLPGKAFVSLKVFDLLGREVTTLASDVLSAGNHSRQWNAVNMPSGVYFYRLQAGSSIVTKKLVLMR